MKRALAIAVGLAGIATAGTAEAQTRVRAGMHTSFGSCQSCDLSERSFGQMKMIDADFSGSSFYRSNLSGGLLDESNLSGTVFAKAILMNVQGEKVNLTDAVLRDANLLEATLTDSSFIGAGIQRAELVRGDFTGSDFSKADLSGATAREATFEGAIFRDTVARLTVFDGADLSGVDFTGADLGNASFEGAEIGQANLSGADLRFARGLKQAQLDSACGDANTLLSGRLTVSYCDPGVIAEFDRAAAQQDYVQAAARLDTAIADLEGMIRQPGLDLAHRRRLEQIHSQLVSSRRALGN